MIVALLLIGVSFVAGLPRDPVLRIPSEEPLRYQHVEGGGGLHLVDLWTKLSDLQEASRFNPDYQNVYHLFTRENPHVSQPLLINNNVLLGMTNYNPQRRTIVLIHTWRETATGPSNAVLVPAYLAAEDVNVILVDWSVGASANYVAATSNTVASGESVARFINWLNGASGSNPGQYHIVGHGLGGHQAGVVARNVEGDVGYVTALDPTQYLWILNRDKFRPEDGLYTEVIHTNAGVNGYLGTLGDVDFYPNGGVNMPGCRSAECDHERSFHYFAESLVTGGFTGRRCITYIAAMSGTCILSGNLQMGGLQPKIGSSGIFRVNTNSRPPFSRG